MQSHPATAPATAPMAPSPPAYPAAGAPVKSSLFTRIFALMLATVVVAQLISLALLALLPPAPTRAMSLSEIVSAVSTPEQILLAQSGNLLAPLPHRAEGGPATPLIEAELARRLGLPAASVQVRLAPAQSGKLVSILVSRGGALVAEPALLGHFTLAVRASDGRWTRYEPRDRTVFDSRERRFILLFLASAFALLPIAWLFAKRLAAPFAQFAEAAERLGRDPSQPPPEIEGPAEVGRAARAFADMQARLSAYVDDRTQMIAAIAHDLRTPLTRLAFRIESLDAPERDAMAGDVQEMEAMVAATMGFSRAAHDHGLRERIELGSLVERIAEDLHLTGRRVTAEALDSLVVDGDALSLRRLFTNLFDNGEKFGGSVHARIYRDANNAIVDIDDEGPGLPPGREAQVFEPFFRLEPSRSRETGGIGLGLSVVRSIARSHGGEVALINRPGGGLRARVTLPLAVKSSRGV